MGGAGEAGGGAGDANVLHENTFSPTRLSDSSVLPPLHRRRLAAARAAEERETVRREADAKARGWTSSSDEEYGGGPSSRANAGRRLSAGASRARVSASRSPAGSRGVRGAVGASDGDFDVVTTAAARRKVAQVAASAPRRRSSETDAGNGGAAGKAADSSDDIDEERLRRLEAQLREACEVLTSLRIDLRTAPIAPDTRLSSRATAVERLGREISSLLGAKKAAEAPRTPPRKPALPPEARASPQLPPRPASASALGRTSSAPVGQQIEWAEAESAEETPGARRRAMFEQRRERRGSIFDTSAGGALSDAAAAARAANEYKREHTASNGSAIASSSSSASKRESARLGPAWRGADPPKALPQHEGRTTREEREWLETRPGWEGGRGLLEAHWKESTLGYKRTPAPSKDKPRWTGSCAGAKEILNSRPDEGRSGLGKYLDESDVKKIERQERQRLETRMVPNDMRHRRSFVAGQPSAGRQDAAFPLAGLTGLY